jgi:KDO2-lipid IV(A) lauroyltransferase
MTYWLYRTLALLPLPIKYGLSSMAAWLLGTVFRYRARVVANNLRNAFPEQNEQWRKAVAQAFLSTVYRCHDGDPSHIADEP